MLMMRLISQLNTTTAAVQKRRKRGWMGARDTAEGEGSGKEGKEREKGEEKESHCTPTFNARLAIHLPALEFALLHRHFSSQLHALLLGLEHCALALLHLFLEPTNGLCIERVRKMDECRNELWRRKWMRACKISEREHWYNQSEVLKKACT